MNEYFVVANSNAAPFFSDTSTQHVKGDSPGEALVEFVKDYKHPCGLYAAQLFASADAYHKHEPHLAEYLSDKAQKQREEATA